MSGLYLGHPHYIILVGCYSKRLIIPYFVCIIKNNLPIYAAACFKGTVQLKMLQVFFMKSFFVQYTLLAKNYKFSLRLSTLTRGIYI